jgi:hypothetical protein
LLLSSAQSCLTPMGLASSIRVGAACVTADCAALYPLYCGLVRVLCWSCVPPQWHSPSPVVRPESCLTLVSCLAVHSCYFPCLPQELCPLLGSVSCWPVQQQPVKQQRSRDGHHGVTVIMGAGMPCREVVQVVSCCCSEQWLWSHPSRISRSVCTLCQSMGSLCGSGCTCSV